MLTYKQIRLGAVSPWLRKVMLTLSSMTSLSVTQKLMNLNITNAKFSENNLVSLLQMESTNLMEVTAIFNGRVSFYTFKVHDIATLLPSTIRQALTVSM